MDFTSPRAWALALLGIHEYSRRLSGARLANQVRERLTDRLLQLFQTTANDGWGWCEESLAYDNARLAHALILNGGATGPQPAMERGLQALRWLMEQQTSGEGYFRPIGNKGFYVRGGMQAAFDQQPTDAQATVSACLEAYRVTSE